MAVLGVLRGHAANGAEVGLAAVALIVSVLGVAFTLLNTTQGGQGWIAFVPVFEAVVVVWFGVAAAKVALAAHVRKMTAVAWLGAYEDALSSEGRRSSIRLRWGGYRRAAAPKARQ